MQTFARILSNNYSSILGQFIANVWISHHSWNLCRSFHHRSLQERRLTAFRNHLRLPLVLRLLTLRSLRWQRNCLNSSVKRQCNPIINISRVFSNSTTFLCAWLTCLTLFSVKFLSTNLSFCFFINWKKKLYFYVTMISNFLLFLFF